MATKVVTGEQAKAVLARQGEMLQKIGNMKDPMVFMQAIIDGRVNVIQKITSLFQLADLLDEPTIGQLRELANETMIWKFLDQFDTLTFVQWTRIRSLTNQLWINEEKKSNYGYPKGWKPKKWQEQVETSKKHWDHLDHSRVEDLINQLGSQSQGADNQPYITPKPYQYFIKYLVKKKDEQPRLEDFYAVDQDGKFIHPYYGQVLEKILQKMDEVIPDFVSYAEDNFGPEYLRLTEKTRQAYLRMENEQLGDFFVFWGQLGLLHKGRSGRQARIMFENNEYGLCLFVIAAILITHPDCLTKFKHLAIDCPGCEFSTGAIGNFSYCPCFRFYTNKLGLGRNWVGCPNADFGSASGIPGE